MELDEAMMCEHEDYDDASRGDSREFAPSTRAMTSRAWPEPLGCQLGVGVRNEVKRPTWLGTQHKVSAMLCDENRGVRSKSPVIRRMAVPATSKLWQRNLETFNFC